jgi:zinc transporter 5/7
LFAQANHITRLISVEILIEAVERLAEGRETKRLTELLIVSSLGLAVNLVGMACFGHHHHAGHDHSHGGHDHGHSHAHDSKGDACNHDHDHASAAPLAASSHSHSHTGHSHENENMRGIFLHVLADTMGSAAVIVSTLLIQYVGWSGWDPLASCVIAVLIFMSSIPLVSSSAQKLLLTVPDDTEYQLRNTLAGVSDLRGVASYTVPRFWMADKVSEKEREGVLGVMHIIATRGSELDDVRERARAYLLSHGMDVVLQVEREGDLKCWCGGNTRSPSTSTSRFS